MNLDEINSLVKDRADHRVEPFLFYFFPHLYKVEKNEIIEEFDVVKCWESSGLLTGVYTDSQKINLSKKLDEGAQVLMKRLSSKLDEVNEMVSSVYLPLIRSIMVFHVFPRSLNVQKLYDVIFREIEKFKNTNKIKYRNLPFDKTPTLSEQDVEFMEYFMDNYKKGAVDWQWIFND